MTDAPATYGTLHAGDVVRGVDDGAEWMVLQVIWVGGLEIVLARGDVEVLGRPAPSMPVSVVRRSDVSQEAAAYAALSGGFGSAELLGERWT